MQPREAKIFISLWRIISYFSAAHARYSKPTKRAVEIRLCNGYFHFYKQTPIPTAEAGAKLVRDIDGQNGNVNLAMLRPLIVVTNLIKHRPQAVRRFQKKR